MVHIFFRTFLVIPGLLLLMACDRQPYYKKEVTLKAELDHKIDNRMVAWFALEEEARIPVSRYETATHYGHVTLNCIFMLGTKQHRHKLGMTGMKDRGWHTYPLTFDGYTITLLDVKPNPIHVYGAHYDVVPENYEATFSIEYNPDN